MFLTQSTVENYENTYIFFWALIIASTSCWLTTPARPCTKTSEAVQFWQMLHSMSGWCSSSSGLALSLFLPSLDILTYKQWLYLSIKQCNTLKHAMILNEDFLTKFKDCLPNFQRLRILPRFYVKFNCQQSIFVVYVRNQGKHRRIAAAQGSFNNP